MREPQAWPPGRPHSKPTIFNPAPNRFGRVRGQDEAWPSFPPRRRVYELLQLDIRVAPDRSLDIHGTIPADRPLTIDSEVSAAVLRDPGPI